MHIYVHTFFQNSSEKTSFLPLLRRSNIIEIVPQTVLCNRESRGGLIFQVKLKPVPILAIYACKTPTHSPFKFKGHVELCVFAEHPETVSISFVNHTGSLLEGCQYTLQCRVEKVAPVQNLTVAFYKGDTMLGSVQSMSSVKTPVNETFTVSFNSSREDNGVQYWCKTELNLGQQGPQNTTEGPHALRTTVYCESASNISQNKNGLFVSKL